MQLPTSPSSISSLTRRAWLPALLIALALSLGACSDGGGDSNAPAANNDTNNDANNDGGCTEGILGCTCIDGVACFPGSGWVCVDDLCKEPTCEPGSLDCACYPNNTCDAGEDDEPLVCRDGVCEVQGCAPGSFGCECEPGRACAQGLTCRFESGRDLCAPVEACEVGTEDCLCGEGRACGPGLTCVQNACIAPGCRPGVEDCFCKPDLSCNEGLQCGEDERCTPIRCTPGSLGCQCDEGACAAPDALCNGDGLCEQIDCPMGGEGCTCIGGSRCVTNEDGQQLYCEDAVCRTPVCAPGELGCACVGGVQCGEGGACVGGVCQVSDCSPGTEFCACSAGFCEQGLRCREDEVCVDGTGFPNNVCGENGACLRGSRCSNSNICRRCTLGSNGCQCDDLDECLGGLVCYAGNCIAEVDLPPRPLDEDICFTHCENDLEVDGELIVCGTDNLLEACVGGRVCEEGSCIFPDEDPVQCLSELGCPHWQTCIDGLCQSECKNNGDCVSSKRCFDHVCRVPCESNGAACPLNFHCFTEDGESGFCRPNVPEEGEPQRRITGGFALNTNTLEFNNTAVTRRFVLFNDSLTFQNFRIVKRRHLLQFADGSSDRAVRAADGVINCDPDESDDCVCDEDDPDDCTCQGPACACTGNSDCADRGFQCQGGLCRPAGCTGGTCPMFWMTMGEGRDEPLAQEEMEVGVPSGGSAEITLSAAADMEGVRYQGTIEVVNHEFGTQTLDINYNEVPEGQWSGEMIYLANFSDRGLARWRVDQTSRNTVEHEPPLANALLRSWVAFRNGRISLDEIQAVMTSVQNGTWKFPNVQADCPSRDGACYPYDIGQLGLEVLTSDRNQFPVPTGVVEMPFGMNLRMPDPEENPGSLVGRIESSKALHYAGDPAVALDFLTSPENCDLEAFGACVAWLEGFEANIFVGGRYLTAPEDTNCTDERDNTYAQVREPWLVAGFVRNTALDRETGRRFRTECRDTLLPFTNSEDQDRFVPTNLSLALSNPVPDGRARRRSLRLVDGAMINQSQLIIFFEERFDSFLGDDEEGFTSYGFMRLTRRATDLDPADENANEIADIYEGATPQDERVEPEGVLAPVCSRELLDQVLGRGGALRGDNVADAVSTLINGVPLDGEAEILDGQSAERVHYFCEDNGLIDGGPDNANSPFDRDRVPGNDACPLARNGVCEDGGPGAERSICALGTDTQDCGQRSNADLDERIECPAGSRVEFFTVFDERVTQQYIAALGCQRDGSCIEVLNRWKQIGVVVQTDPRFRCADPNAVFCDSNRQDLREGKLFYAATEESAVFVQLQSLISEAFRYKTRFRNRDGLGLGFSPDICVPDSDAVPYCYDPQQIEQIQARIDCLLHIHQDWYDSLSGSPGRDSARRMLDSFLTTSFSQVEERRPNNLPPITHDGFERELSQLMIMLGDESFTDAFASRFDLAEVNNASFDGTLFEPDGINLSGAVGFEMVSLYRAAQTYQIVLDRFYGMSPAIWEATQFGVDARNFVTAETVLRYFDRVVRASTQKARTWGEIAKRYQALGRPDLARSVSERAYTATYLESVVMSRMMFQILEEATLAENRDQIVHAIDDAQLRYKVALVDMQNAYSEIEDNITIFGFEPDFIPFPPQDSQDFRQSNAFEVLLTRSRNKVQFAREREELALNQTRDFDSNEAQFQSELTQVRNNFENQLAELCGTFVVDGDDDDPNNDRVLPAIKKYASLSDDTTLYADPCGFAGNGQIFQAMASLEEIAIDSRALQVQVENVLEEVEIERERVSAQCGEILETADFLYGKCDRSTNEEFVDRINPFDNPDQNGCLQVQINELQDDIRAGQFVVARLQQVQSVLGTMAGLTKCTVGFSTDCPTAAASLSVFLAGTALTETGIAATEIAIGVKESQIADLERFKMKWQTEQECDMAKIESEARVRGMLLRLRELELESLRIEYRSRLALSEIDRLRNQAKRLEAQQIDAEQLSINAQAAINNPNVRIYKNDAIINAEISFDDAIREVYKLTKVFEYYTSTSYANKNDLFLIRMISRGDKNLENYLNELESAFFDFEEFFGHPSNRVHIISLKNDILNIPYSDDEGKALSETQRTERMRQRLTDPANLDRNGYIALSFSTNLEDLSPLTRNHKILYVEADLYGSDTGDLVGRVYLRQKGTSVIKGVRNDKQFHRFDERTGVINTIFGGVRFFENSIYQNFRMRDRPFVNTQWELVINQRDELVNQDINLNAMTDVRLNIYYTDFTIF